MIKVIGTQKEIEATKQILSFFGDYDDKTGPLNCSGIECSNCPANCCEELNVEFEVIE